MNEPESNDEDTKKLVEEMNASDPVDLPSVKWTLEQLVNLLNDGLKVNQQAISNMLQTRSYCNDELVQHKDIICIIENCKDGPRQTVGILGILNGWSKPLGFRIEAIMAGAEVLMGTGEITGFRLMPVDHVLLRRVKGTCNECGKKEVIIDMTDMKMRCEACGLEGAIPPLSPGETLTDPEKKETPDE